MTLLAFLISLLTIFTACNANIEQVTSLPIDQNEVVMDENDIQEPDVDNIIYAHSEQDDNNPSVDEQDDARQDVITPTSCIKQEDFIDADVVTIRFYYHSLDIDPNVYSLPESFLYNSEEIYINNFRDELIRLMHEYTGIRILDLWFEGSKLYVDLHEDALRFINQGTAGSTISINILERTLASVPGITSFEMLLNGQRGVEKDHFIFGFIAIVENGEIIRHERFEVHSDDVPPRLPTYNDYTPTVNIGLTDDNVRLYFVDNERVRQWYPAYRLFDLNEIEYYHEFIHSVDGFRIVFTTEATVFNFRFLDIVWNDNFFRETAAPDERLYLILDVIYFLPELTPEVPFVLTGALLGCALATHGFSFEDSNGEIRYFGFNQCGRTGVLAIGEF